MPSATASGVRRVRRAGRSVSSEMPSTARPPPASSQPHIGRIPPESPVLAGRARAAAPEAGWTARAKASSAAAPRRLPTRVRACATVALASGAVAIL